jgi:hypothetical protein
MPFAAIDPVGELQAGPAKSSDAFHPQESTKQQREHEYTPTNNAS